MHDTCLQFLLDIPFTNLTSMKTVRRRNVSRANNGRKHAEAREEKLKGGRKWEHLQKLSNHSVEHLPLPLSQIFRRSACHRHKERRGIILGKTLLSICLPLSPDVLVICLVVFWQFVCLISHPFPTKQGGFQQLSIYYITIS